MLNKKLFILPIAVLLVSNVAVAHTTFRATALEGNTQDNVLTINHGCESSAGDKSVVAQSVVLPGESGDISASDGSTITSVAEILEQGTLAGLVSLVQDRSIFLTQNEKTDVNGEVVGFHGKNGILSTELHGRVPMITNGVTFLADSCVSRLRVEAAVADICVTSKPTIQAGKVNLWIPDNGSTYATLGAAAGVEGVGDPARLTINRDLTANPLSAACGAGITVTITPTAADINTKLGIPGLWKF
jgi:hypothetical protein